MKKNNLRVLAAKTLFQVLEQGQSLRDAMPEVQTELSEKDKAWVREMVYGVLRHLPLLQFWLRQLLDKPLKNKNKIGEHVILLGFYQLAFTRVSDHAAVSETVAACPALKIQGLKGLVNAILRNFMRNKLAENKPNDEQILSGLPKWLFQQVKQHYPENLANILDAMMQKAPIWLRVNRQKIDLNGYTQLLSDKGINFELSEQHPDAIILSQSCDITTLPGYEDGLFAVQDGAAQLAAHFLQPQKDDHILDACAAPGGKLCHILELQPQVTKCIALDVDASRLQRVHENLTRLGHNTEVITGDASNNASWWDGQQFDRILLDAPCSATGIIRRHPDIKWLRKASDIDTLVTLQGKILDELWQTLKPGGHLLYATCSILSQENSQQIAHFLQRQPQATLVPITDSETIENPGWQILPGQQQMDGFYYAMLLKSE
ncbi:16S rRNA (cytosine(967)-C(5))-methyltransferase RsmB [Alteromonadaceae bacterium BrNp21-10]|nr:16S rRNA (cytosine(967)-C(5))-methyltransferase RsmB [Alteromonadaceae bacterium BrNp21-10]